MNSGWLCVGVLGWACVAGGVQEGLVSGEPLRVRTNGGAGLLAAPKAITTKPVGCARVSGENGRTCS